MTYEKNLEGRRTACTDLSDLYLEGKLKEVRDFVAERGIHLGRTERWKDACKFLVDNFDVADTHEDPDHYRRWAILQGITFMNMYAS
ncbi:hypothetical protein GCM10018965_084160 [Nonomuraea roseola]